MTQHAFDDAVAALRAAGEPTRLRLLAVCADGELTVGEITRVLGQSQPRVSRHLKLLCDAHLLERFREEHWVYYRVAGLGEGADLARQLLGLVAPADRIVTRDRQRANQIRAARAAAAAEHLPDDESSTASREMTSELTAGLHAAVSGERIGQLLDIGSGLGRVLRVLAPEADEAVGLDISVEALRFARSTLHAAGLNRCTLRRGDMYHLPFPAASFDTVTMDAILHGAKDPVAVLRQAAQALRPAGRVVLLDEVEKLTRRLGHPMIDGVLRDWLERAGFAIQSVQRVSTRGGEIVIIVARRATRFEAAA
ncbi:MAG TPA: metalloregulator ArsR/SmtB family transcription factor [Steroidobacteraceae bacterium]|nr:metalloregulator ArsR/SmtB family transcription factor [Steroidobacteraceae bacterium]